MHTPQIVFVCWLVASFTAAVFQHGQELKVNLFTTCSRIAVILGLTIWGGFFAGAMHAPQIVFLCWLVVGFTTAVFRHGQTAKADFFVSLVRIGIILGLMVWGGFFS